MLDPYTPIEKVPLFTADNMQSRGFSIRLESQKTASGWKEVGLVSDDYLLVPNHQVRDMALEIADRSSMAWSEDKVFFDGKRYLYALIAAGSVQTEVEVGDVVSVGMLFENSYDGSRRLSASLFAHRLACSNGMLMPQYFARMRFKHDNSARDWEEEVMRALSMIHHASDGLERFADGARRLAAWPLGSVELACLRRDVLTALPLTLWARTLDRFLLEEDHTGWGLLNAGTHELWHSERTTIADFGHNERFTTSLMNHATKALPAADRAPLRLVESYEASGDRPSARRDTPSDAAA